MVYLHFSNILTEEEEQLKLKYAKLRKKKKALQALKSVKPETKTQTEARTQATKRPIESAGDALKQAKKLVQSGAIQIGADKREKTGFKRSKYFEKKLKDPEKAPVGFQPFSATHPDEEEKSETGTRTKRKDLYDRFVSSGVGYDRERDDRRDREHIDRPDRREPPKKGNTIYVRGHRITEELLRKAASNFGVVLNISMERDKGCGFVSFEKMESAEQAISEMNGSMIENIQLQVSMARHQPTLELTQDPSSTGWSSIAASNSQKGSGYKDKRDIITYDDEDIF
ncbi:negative elongation factor E-like [Gigantopelta aegis]|uniref:negative elongation factor E-like n=1 Tax=Gigantopelta aegis TaxID=1735272 RepID=UPI001B88E3FB|nr:negative elongation factor E-like [Gigantopelta aegis]